MKHDMTHFKTFKMLQSAQALINHLITWGEVTRFELGGIAGARDWIAIFKDAGILCPVTVGENSDVWTLSPEFWSLLQEDSEKAVRSILFNVPDYHEYLVSILAEGAVSAAKQGLHNEVENWSGNELLPFLTFINRMLNRIEVDGKRIIDQKADQISLLFASLPERQTNWDNWNQLLLGRTARPQDLFDFVLKRFIPYATTERYDAHGCTPALLPVIPLIDADGNAQFMNLAPAPWNISRAVIQSGIELFDEHGKPMGDNGTAENFRNVLQDSLIEQPFYKAVTQLAINHYRAKTVSSPNFELYLQSGVGLSEVELFYEAREIGLLKDWLPVLVQCQECFAARSLNDEQVENMLENLLALEILDWSDDNLVLHDEFQSTLMASRLRSVFRPGKSLQDRMIETVRKNLHKSEQQEAIT
ncbi:MAG: hypothetical protein APF84_12855 [Gracilibacter sp. BRH_c7a]|nr:MAG: hypothetical protein APF84_12855 [Gracilibacter sp. BRH_c7a]